MIRRQFGRTGLSVSILGFGAAPIGFLATEKQEVSAVLNYLLDNGLNLIDTAAMYAGSEEAIGEAIGHRRSDYVLVSKCGQTSSDLPGRDWSPEVIAATIDRALRRLRTDHLDVMLLHSCSIDVLQKGDAVGALAVARDAGKIRFAGYSGDNETGAYAATLSDIAVIETSINICDQSNIDTVLPAARANDAGVIAKRPIANSAWRGSSNLPGFYQEYARPYVDRFAAMDLRLDDFAPYTEWSQIALQFTLSQPGVSAAIVGTTKVANARRNIEAANMAPITDEQIQRIRSAFALAQGRSGETWAGLT
jgi:aryl-alcohol dehydrogenase-like predicted oxidoreductase